MPCNGPARPFGAMVEYHPYFCARPIWTASVWSKRLARYISRFTREESGHETSWSQTLKNWRRRMHPNSTLEGSQCKGSVNAAKKWKLHIHSRRWNSQNLWERTESENIHLNPGASGTRRKTRNSSRKI